MNILITGATGFIGQNLIEKLAPKKGVTILTYDPRTDQNNLDLLSSTIDFVFHLAAVHRPLDQAEFTTVNVLYFAELLQKLRGQNNSCPVLFTSSYQAIDQTPYGQSKLAAEEELKRHAEANRSRAIIYRLTNTFGRYARPNAHSVVATFCYNIARELPVAIHDPDRMLQLYYIDDVINSFLAHLDGWVQPDADGFYRLPENLKYKISLQALADKIYSFKTDIDRCNETTNANEFTAKLLATFRSYIALKGVSG